MCLCVGVGVCVYMCVCMYVCACMCVGAVTGNAYQRIAVSGSVLQCATVYCSTSIQIRGDA